MSPKTLLTILALCLMCGATAEQAAAQSPAVAEKVSQLASHADVVQWAQRRAAEVEREIGGYTAILESRERVDGELGEREIIELKIRHRPFSVYARILQPESGKGNEAIYVEGRNDGKLLVHTTGITGSLLGTLKLDPAGSLATTGRRHPITEIGILHLCRVLVQMDEPDGAAGSARVQAREVRLNGRACVGIEVVHPERRDSLPFHILRVFVDNELDLPVRYEQYDWPSGEGAAPVLLEEYLYRDLKLNPDLTDADFDPANPAYGFP